MSERKFASLLRAHVQRQAALTLKAAGTAGHTDLQTDIPRHFWDEFEVGGFTAGNARDARPRRGLDGGEREAVLGDRAPRDERRIAYQSRQKALLVDRDVRDADTVGRADAQLARRRRGRTIDDKSR